MNEQVKVPLDVNALKLTFRHVARRPNGAEAFRLLQYRLNPATLGRPRAKLIRITNPACEVSLDKLACEVVSWEKGIVD